MVDDTAVLERRYRRLLLAYPVGYRTARGDEIVATLLDTAGPGRRTPRLADAADLVSCGLRRRLGTATIAGFDTGLTIAAPVALTLAAGIAAFAWWRVEPISAGSYMGGPPLFGRFRTVGPVAYPLWLVAVAGRTVLRQSVSRALIGLAIAVTLALPLVSAVSGIDRPPLWVLMALSAFGLLALAGTSAAAGASSRPSADERLSLVAGTVAVALASSATMVAWPPPGGGFGYYYQPTIARVGIVVAATVCVVLGIAVTRIVRRRSAQEWLWAMALLGLPAGWLGPFDSAGLHEADHTPVPTFGRLAQVLLATCLAMVVIVWLAQRRTHGRDTPATPRALGWAGATTVGYAIGLAVFLVGAWLYRPYEVPGHVVVTVGVLFAVGLLAWVRGRGLVRGWPAATGGFAAALVMAWLVAAYDNGWTAGAWLDYAHTSALVVTLAFLPLSVCGIAAARPLSSRTGGWLAVSVLVLCIAWIGYVALPFALSWGPVLLVLIVCCGALALSGRKRDAAG